MFEELHMEVRETVQEAVMKTIPKKMNAREMLWGGRKEGGSCLGIYARIKDFKFKNKIK